MFHIALFRKTCNKPWISLTYRYCHPDSRFKQIK